MSKKKLRKQPRPSKSTVITEPEFISTLKASIDKFPPKSVKKKSTR
jgi:hypothetical protein